jgi:alkylation response protein AidB-like acyl-CoA dehydrogenase
MTTADSIHAERALTGTSTMDAARLRLMQNMVDQVAPVLRETAAVSEAARRLAPEAVDALIDAGIPRALLPAAYLGAELGPVYGIRLFEELGCIDAAAAWVGMISAAGAWLLSLLPAQATAEILADPRAVINGSLFPPLTAEPVPGGYRVSGRTAFASGCNYATWLQCQAIVLENGTPKIGADGIPKALMVHFPAGEAEIIDNWNTLGMRGTGSHDFRAAYVFVPDHRAWPLGPVTIVNPAFTDGLARMGVWWFSPLIASVSLGIARAAIADLIALARSKTPSYTQAALADRPVVQERLARARAAVDAARDYLYGSLAAAEAAVRTQPRLSIEQGIPLALAGSHAIEAANQAVDLVHGCVGTSGIRNELRFQQYFRDVHTISQHAFASPSRFESVGKLLLGHESDWPFYYL